jgi:hypothetical protein
VENKSLISDYFLVLFLFHIFELQFKKMEAEEEREQMDVEEEEEEDEGSEVSGEEDGAGEEETAKKVRIFSPIHIN